MQVTAFKCVVCGKISSGRMTGRRSDRSERFPRRHNGPDREFCEGNYEFAEWVIVEASVNAITGKVKLPTNKG